MDFAVPAPLASTLDTLRRFVDEHVTPLEAQARTEGFVAVAPRLDALRERARTAGWWLPQIARDHGGMGLSVLEHGLVSEVLGRSPLGHYVLNCQAPDAGNMELLLEHGTEAQRARWLEPLLAGRIRSCFAMTEPEHAGSNPVWLGTRARRDGDAWVLDGHKWFCTAADGAAFAIVMAVTEPEAAPHERASMILVPTDAPGFRHVRNIPVMGEAGDGWMSHAELRLESVRVPLDHLLGRPGQGFALAQARLGPGRIHHCMRWIGLCERAFDEMARRAVARRLSPEQRLADTQTVQHWIAESRAQIDAARLLVLHAAWRIDHVGMKAAREDISLIKFHTAEVLMRVVDRAIQCHGALGITDDTVLSWIYRHERGARIYDGPDEVHKTVVARRILQRYAPGGRAGDEGAVA
jgi:alkylation response protein AidB-like acyl-CoA dehydrogenase